MRDEDRVRIRHMIDACEATIQFVAGRSRDELDTDRMLLFAVVRGIEIVGEAANKVSTETQSAHSDIPWGAIIGMRNRLVHAYFDIDADTVWVAASKEIPELLPRLRALS